MRSLILIFLFFIVSCSGEKSGNVAGLKGTVKTLSESVYSVVYESGEIRKGSLKSSHSSTFDISGKQLGGDPYVIHGDPGNEYISIYDQYDKAGNWLRKITFRSSEPLEISEREIEYHITD